MRHFLSHRLSHHAGKNCFGASSASYRHTVLSPTLIPTLSPTSSAKSSPLPARKLCLTLLVVCIALLSSSLAQPSPTPVPTSRTDNARDGANSNETLLTPANVNQSGFHKAFTFVVDYVVMAQPLYVPQVNIGGVNHNVIYVATMADSVYAIDADTGAQLWWTNFTNPAQGIYTAQVSTGTMPCGTGQGYYQSGIIGTPVIDTTTNTMYLVAKTVVNGTVQHNLHALDIATGIDVHPPILIAATSTSTGTLYAKQKTTVFNSLHQMNRPGLLLLNGVLYLGFGSNSCNDSNTGWVLSYDEATLSQLNVFNTSPYHGLTSIWQAGNGLAADEANNIFVETAESCEGCYDVPSGGQTYSQSVLKLSPDLTLTDYFTPWYVAFLTDNDMDLSSTGALILPDQPGPYPHELIASGKQGIVYVLDRDNMGHYSVGNDSQIVQELTLLPGINGDSSGNQIQFGSPAYWNNTVYFATKDAPLMAFPLSGGLLGTPLTTTGKYVGSHSPSISANGNSNGIVWVISSPQLYAFNAVTLTKLYASGQAPGGRDTLPPLGHFVTQTVANGRVYVGTQNSLVAYGLFDQVTFTGGSAQTASVATTLPLPIQFQIGNPYNGLPDAGVTVNFSDGCLKAGSISCGTFNPTSAVTDSNGNAFTNYTVPQKAGTYTLTLTDPTKTNFGTATTTATATPDAAIRVIYWSGNKQTGAAGSTLAKPLVVQAQDTYGNGISGITVTFTPNKGTVSPSPVVTNSSGLASTTLQLPTTVATVTVIASSTGFKNAGFTVYSVAGPAANIAPTSGNNQTAPNGTQLPGALAVLVTDQYNNPVSGVSVTFSDGGAGGTFSNGSTVATGANGTATQLYTLPAVANETVTITATAAGVSNPAVFTEYGQ